MLLLHKGNGDDDCFLALSRFTFYYKKKNKMDMRNRLEMPIIAYSLMSPSLRPHYRGEKDFLLLINYAFVLS